MSNRNPDQELRRNKNKGRRVPPRPEANERMGPPGAVRFRVMGHIHPQTFEPLVRLQIGDMLDLSFPAKMMRSVADLIDAQIVMAEMESGFAKRSLTMGDFMAAEFPAPTIRESVLEGTKDFREVIREAWAGGASIVDLQVGEEPDAPPTETPSGE